MSSNNVNEDATRENNIKIVTAAIAAGNAIPPPIPMIDLVKKIGEDNKLKLYVTYEKYANGELSIKDQYYIDAIPDGNVSVVKKVDVNA